MILERGFGFGMPRLALLVRQILPGEPDDLGERAMVGHNLGRNVVALDEQGAVGIGWTGNVAVRPLLTVARATMSGTIVGRREELRVGGRNWNIGGQRPDALRIICQGDDMSTAWVCWHAEDAAVPERDGRTYYVLLYAEQIRSGFGCDSGDSVFDQPNTRIRGQFLKSPMRNGG